MKNYFIVFVFLALLVVFSTLFYFETLKITEPGATAWTEDQRADCAVVLTGGPGRIREGFSLLTQERIQKLIISGVYPQSSLREIFPEWPFYGAISEENILLEKRSNTTYGNAQQTLPLIEALKCRSLILVTSRSHMYRAHRIFKSVFPKDMPIHSRAIVYGTFEPRWGELAIETIKSLFYSVWAYD